MERNNRDTALLKCIRELVENDKSQDNSALIERQDHVIEELATEI